MLQTTCLKRPFVLSDHATILQNSQFPTLIPIFPPFNMRRKLQLCKQPQPQEYVSTVILQLPPHNLEHSMFYVSGSALNDINLSSKGCKLLFKYSRQSFPGSGAQNE